MATTYTKLKDGSWGLRSTDGLTAGSWVMVRKASGEEKREIVGKILWTGDGVTLATIQGKEKQASESRSRGGRRGGTNRYPRTGCSCGSREGIFQDSDCWQCRHDAE